MSGCLRALSGLVFVALVFVSSLAHAGIRTDQDEAIVSRVCASQAPVLVIDTFSGNPTNSADIDLNGDGTYDIHHGEFVSRLIELNGQRVIREVIGTPVFSYELLEVLNSYADRLERGELRLSWINFSQGFTVEISLLNALIGAKDEVTEKNVHLYARRVLEELWTTRPKLKLKELDTVFKRLEALGVPVFVAAANSGFKEVNLYSLFPNVLSVGAIDLNGGKAPYSADNSAVTLWRQGSIKSYSTSEGIDVNGDGIADFSLFTPEISESLLNSFKGKPASRVTSQVPKEVDDMNDNNRTQFFELAAKLPAGMYSTKEILLKTLATPFQQARYIQSLGNVFYLDGKYPYPLFFMDVDNNGALKTRAGMYQGAVQFRNVLYGTSFSSPSICNGERTPDRFAL